jgi:selenocysteine-specific elongation factor
VTGTGVEELRKMLIEEAKQHAARQSEGQHFRYAIDRTFTVAGSGTVVTGTVFSGVVAAGDKLVISPAGLPVRVRSIQIHGKPAERAQAGERCALNLTGSDLGTVRRGDWVLAAPIHRPAERLDARMTLLKTEEHAMEHWTPVHLHLGTSDVTARLATRGGTSVNPGGTALVQLVLDQPVCALRGDRFILRDQSASRTLGGGFVLDPFAPATRRHSRQRLAELAALENDQPENAFAALVKESERPIDLVRFELLYNMTSERAAAIFEKANVVRVGKDGHYAITASRYNAVREAVLAELAAFHRREPQAIGAEIEKLRQAIAPELDAEAFGTVLRRLADERKVEASGSTARLPGHDATANAADDRLWQTVRPALESAGYNIPPLRELALQVRLKEAVVKDFLYRKAKSGEVMRVTADRFYPRSTLATLAAIAQATAQAQPTGQFTAAQYRDATGIGRSLAIEILEFLDSLGITQRVGDARKMRKDFAPILGAALAPAKPPAQNAQKAAPKAAPPRRPMPAHRR